MASKDVFELVRSGAVRDIGPSTFAVYLVMRDLVWRSKSRGRRQLREAAKNGELAASVRREKIGELTGLSGRSVTRAIAKLESVGWIVPRRSEGQISVYALGEIVDGAEQFFAGPLTNCPGYPRHVCPDPLDTGVHTPLSFLSRGTRTIKGEPTREEPTTPESGGESGSVPRSKTRPIRKTKKNPRPKQKSKTDRTPQPPSRPTWDALDMEPATPTLRSKMPVPDPENPKRHVDPTELRHLQSARAKAKANRRDDYTGLEAVAAWRAHFWLAFGFDDPDLNTAAARGRLARIFVTRARQWEDGSRGKLMQYLRAAIRWWREKKEADELGTVPTLTKVLERKPTGEVSWLYKRWKSGGLKRG